MSNSPSLCAIAYTFCFCFIWSASHAIFHSVDYLLYVNNALGKHKSNRQIFALLTTRGEESANGNKMHSNTENDGDDDNNAMEEPTQKSSKIE